MTRYFYDEYTYDEFIEKVIEFDGSTSHFDGTDYEDFIKTVEDRNISDDKINDIIDGVKESNNCNSILSENSYRIYYNRNSDRVKKKLEKDINQWKLDGY
ncbi:MAG: hypothetical protein IMZ52_02740 [Actinobacteria bacterium]|nr:hypothetical protein [Actinomycetota bacterium]MBE3114834.1 hypothetical protein [Actinomycetota bacterium]